MSKMLDKTNPRTQSDEAWKYALDCWFKPFIDRFWPDIAEQIDWDMPINELTQELPTITDTTALVGKQIVDKLYRIQFKSHQDIMLLLHIEIQGDREKYFAARMFEYTCKLYLRYRLPIVPLVVLSDDHPN